MSRVEIAPGVALTCLPGEKFKRSRFVVRLIVPSDRSTATALALLPHVLDRRCALIPDPTQLSRKLFALYGADLSSDSYTLGANRVFSVGISGLKNAYALAGEDLEKEYVELVCQLLFEPYLENGAFAPQDVEIEKEKQADFLRSEMNEKRLYCLQQASRKLFGDSLLGVEAAGYLEDVAGVTPKALYSTYQDLLASAQVEVSVFGMQADYAKSKILEHMEEIARRPVSIAPGEVAKAGTSFDTYEEPMDALQGKLALLCTWGEIPTARDAAVMRVATALLGGLPTSRLFMNVREKQSLCYYCAARYSAFSGVITIDSGVEHKNLQKAADAILHELEEMQKTPVTQEELGDAHRALAGAFVSAQDSPISQENWAFSEYMRGTGLSMEEFADMMRTVSAEEVRDVLAKFKPVVQYAITQKEGTV